jgi:hypothetical protein
MAESAGLRLTAGADEHEYDQNVFIRECGEMTGIRGGRATHENQHMKCDNVARQERQSRTTGRALWLH